MDVAIVGLGMHPFGGTPTMSGLEQGAAAVREALADAGTDFKRMEFAFGGSQDSGNADSLVNLLGLTGLQFTNVCLLYTSPSPRDQRGSRMPSSA